MATKATTKTRTDDSTLSDAVAAEPSEVETGSVVVGDLSTPVVVPEGTVVAEAPQEFPADVDPRLQPVDNHPPAPTCPHCGEEL